MLASMNSPVKGRVIQTINSYKQMGTMMASKIWMWLWDSKMQGRRTCYSILAGILMWAYKL
jgi:hypothetical protein